MYLFRSLPLAATAAVLLTSSLASAGVLFSTRFEAGPLADAEAFDVTTSGGATATATLATAGTIDTYMGKATQALELHVNAHAGRTAMAGVVTHELNVANTEADPARLSLGIDLWVSELRPVRITLASVGADGRVSGTLTKTVTPPVAGAYYRFSPDLGSFATTDGRFDPKAPRLRVGFEVSAADDAFTSGDFVLRADNLSYAAPAYYVSAKGRDSADGRTEATAFATPQRAIEAAGPGDVILVGDGTYVSKARQSLVRLDKAGEPDRWIVLRAAPGQKPVFRGTGWDVVTVTGRGAYLEFRGLTCRGYADEISAADAQADEAMKSKDGKRYFGDARMNTNGFAADGRTGTESDGHPHHLRFIDNTIRFQPGAGIGLCFPDHITIEGNLAEDNCHRMRYGGSGISILSAWNFDADPGYRLFVVANRSARNRCFVKWSEIGKISDGNGIIIDQFNQFDYKTMKYVGTAYTGRTLVQNNLVYGNGGSGIHAFASSHVDIANNTAYHNAQSPELNWRQIFAGSKCRDIRITNNILWAQKGRPTATTMGDSADVIYDHNLIYGDGDNGTGEGGGLGTSKGGKQATVTNPVQGDPKLVRATLDADDADFRLGRDSAAVGAGTRTGPGVPIVDLAGLSRLGKATIDLGAYATPAP